jgi:CheY-like chemotaxis protein
MSNTTSIASGKTIVLVNDELVQRTKTVLWLENAGYAVRAFECASDALTSMQDCAIPDLIITDLFMPGIDGWRFCRLLKSAEFSQLNQVPVMIASATYSGDDASRITRDLGAELLLSLPTSREELLHAVQDILERRQPDLRLAVLIIEDCHTMAKLLAKAFRDGQYQPSIATDRPSAEQLLDGRPFDIVMLDYHLPGIAGWRMLDLVRERLPYSVIILMTADPAPRLALECMQHGASAYLKKPFEAAYLMDLCFKLRRERSLLRVEELLEQRTRELQASEERYRLLYRELRHRIMNSIAIINAMIGLEVNHGTTAETRAALDRLNERVSSIATLYEYLHITGTAGWVALDHYLGMIRSTLAELYGHGSPGELIAMRTEALDLATDKAATFGLIATELITNAFKHGRHDPRLPALEVNLFRSRQGIQLEVRNRKVADSSPAAGSVPAGSTDTPPAAAAGPTTRAAGVANPDTAQNRHPEPQQRPATYAGSGLQLVHALAEQLAGTVEHTEIGDSVVYRLLIPDNQQADGNHAGHTPVVLRQDCQEDHPE